MSSDKNQLEPYIKKQNAKLTQVVLNFFTKSVQVVLQARSLNENTKDLKGVEPGSKINKWFNLHIYTSDVFKEDLKLWKSCSDLSQVPPLIIETYLDMRQLTSLQILVLKDDNNNGWTVAKGGGKKQEVVLERWLIEFDANLVSGSAVDELPLIYKQAIILFRSLYGSTRLMPAYKLKKELNKQKSNKLVLCNRVLDGKQPISSKGRIGLSKSIIPHQMLTTESHVSQKLFQPIQTSVGTLKVSIAYRNHHNFCIHDNEEVLSTHFISMDSDKTSDNLTMKGSEEPEDMQSNALVKVTNQQKPFSSSNVSMSVSPCTSHAHIMKESSPGVRKHSWGSSYTAYGPQRTSIQPFKVGSISSSPPPSTPPVNYGTSLERRISITSNKSTSNASLAAMLRNPRGSNSSGTATIPIGGNSMNVYNTPIPKSVSSSHGSNLVHDDNFFPGETSNTPKFSSSFGSRASRRHSNSMRNNPTDTSLLAVSSGLVSSGTPLSGIYLDDDISDFVRMIDSKSDLRFSTYNSNESKGSYLGSNSQVDALSRFHSLKSQHQHLSDSVNASLILHHNQVGSRHSSRKSSHSVYSPPSSLQIGSYDNPHLPSVESRLKEHSDELESRRSSSSRRASNYQHSRSHSTSPLKSGSTNKLATTAAVSTATAHAVIHNTATPAEPVISGLATSPSVYSKGATVHYENVFDDDDDDDDDDDEEHVYYSRNQQLNNQGDKHPDLINSRGNRPSGNTHVDDEDDDLLFTMSDMNLTKN